MKKWILGVTVAIPMLMAGLPSSAYAATAQTVTVQHSAYMVAAPKTGSTHVALEPTGTQLVVENGSTSYWWHVKDAKGRQGYITRNTNWTRVSSSQGTSTSSQNTPSSSSSQSTSSSSQSPSSSSSSQSPVSTTFQLPPGVSYDPSVKAVAGLDADMQTKLNAVLQVAESKMGTPYEWGHNEDRGQTGFDCSNFTSYVYHHALGYVMSTASRTQYSSVGTSVPISSMQPGDLLVFDQGGHVGIYIGNGQMIQEGGGLAKVGYLKVAPGSYWYQHLSAVKRMF